MSRAQPNWDMVVIGGGTAGLVGAQTAAALGARVMLVERDRTGGDCLWTGCVPSKTVLSAASAVASTRRDQVRPGPADSTRPVGGTNFARAMDSVKKAILTIQPVDSPEALRDAGVDVVTGVARFIGRTSIEVAGLAYNFQHALVATGARPLVPDIPGLAGVPTYTSETVWGMSTLPARLLVIGGGPVGCELAQAFARLGSSVTLSEAQRRLLPDMDSDVSRVLQRALQEDGIDVRVGSTVVRVEPAGEGGLATLSGAPHGALAFDAILLAAGREPRSSGLGLGLAGVTVDGSAVAVDRFLRTSNRSVYAAGDVTGPPYLTHLAAQHAGLAVGNALLGLRRAVPQDPAPRVVFTDPEVACVGASTAEHSPAGFRRRGRRVLVQPHTHVDRAVTDSRTEGFTKVVVGPRQRIVGATIVGPRAGESIGEMSLAVRAGVSVSGLATVMHPYPTYNDGAWLAAVMEVRRQVSSPSARRAARSLLAVRGIGARVSSSGRRGP